MENLLKIKSHCLNVEYFDIVGISDLETKIRRSDVLSISNYGVSVTELGDVDISPDIKRKLAEENLKFFRNPIGNSIQSYKFVIKFKTSQEDLTLKFFNKEMADAFDSLSDEILT